MTISIITINYHSRDYLRGLLTSLDQNLFSNPKNSFGYELLVVNNEETPLELNIPLSIPPVVINTGNNLGFGAANNLAARQAKGDWLFFLNPDIELKDDSLLDMFAYLANNQATAAIGPQIYLPQRKSSQPWTCGKKISLSDVIFRNSINKPWKAKAITSVDWLSGTALLVRKKAFDQVSGFDPQFFMYFEDQDLCLRLKKLGYGIKYFPQASVHHFDGKSWNSLHNKKASYYASQDYFFRKHHGLWQSWMLKILRLPLIFWLKIH